MSMEFYGDFPISSPDRSGLLDPSGVFHGAHELSNLEFLVFFKRILENTNPVVSQPVNPSCESRGVYLDPNYLK